MVRKTYSRRSGLVMLLLFVVTVGTLAGTGQANSVAQLDNEALRRCPATGGQGTAEKTRPNAIDGLVARGKKKTGPKPDQVDICCPSGLSCCRDKRESSS